MIKRSLTKSLFPSLLKIFVLFLLTTTSPLWAGATTIPGTSIFITTPPLWKVADDAQHVTMSFSRGSELIELRVYPFDLSKNMTSDIKKSLDGCVESLDDDFASNGGGWYKMSDNYETTGGDLIRLVLYKSKANRGAGRLVYLFRHYNKSLVVIKWGGSKYSYRSLEGTLLSCGRSIGINGLPDLEDLEKKLIVQCKAAPSNLALRSELARTRVDIAGIHNAAGELDLAASYLMSATKLEPGNSDYLEKLGDSFQYLTSPMAPHAAAAFYEQSLALNPTKRTLRIKFASTLGATREYWDALEQFKILTRNDGKKPDDTYIKELAVIFAQLKQQEQGIKFCQEMKKLGGGERFTVTEAILTRGLGNHGDAVKLLEGVVQSTTIDAPLLSYGKALLQRYKESRYGRID